MKPEPFSNPYWERNRNGGHTSAAALWRDPSGARVAIYRDAAYAYPHGLRFAAVIQSAEAADDDASGFSIRAADGFAFETRTLRDMVEALRAAGYPLDGARRVYLPRIEGGAQRSHKLRGVR